MSWGWLSRTGWVMALALVAAPLAAQSLQQRVEARLAEAGPGIRFGIVVADEAGNELVAINPDGRFIPGSNTKMVTVAAALAALPDLDRPDAAGGAAVRLEGEGTPDVVLVGNGDARLSADPACVANCLSALADAVAARTRRVRHVVGDDSLFPDERWSPGMSWNNIPTRSGTATSALTLDDNEVAITVIPGAPGKPPQVEGSSYYRIDNRAVTVAGGATAIGFDRLPMERTIRLTGTIAAGAEPRLLRLAIDDPAHHAAWALQRMLEARGVRVVGEVMARHRAPRPSDDPAVRGSAPPPRPPRPDPIASLTPPPLAEDAILTNKVSQNLHAELLLRRVGLVAGTGSIADGLAAVRGMLDRAGVPPAAIDLSDGSGMSSYNRMSPRGLVRLMRWIGTQPWGAAWRATLPTPGEGTLARRLAALKGRVAAKTGTLNATNALSGHLTTAGGRTLLFAAFANDVPPGVSGTAALDAVVEIVAAEP